MRAAWWLASYGPLPWSQRAIFYLGVAFFAATREHLYCVFKYPKGLESLTTDPIGHIRDQNWAALAHNRTVLFRQWADVAPIASSPLLRFAEGADGLRRAHVWTQPMGVVFVVASLFSAIGLGGQISRLAVAASFAYLSGVMEMTENDTHSHTLTLLLWATWLLALLDGADDGRSIDGALRARWRRWRLGETAKYEPLGAAPTCGVARQAILVAALYAFFASGTSKLRTAGFQFFDGETVCNHVRAQYKTGLFPEFGVWLVTGADAAGRCALLASASLLLEVVGPLLVLLWPRLRSLWLLSAVGLHLGIAAAMLPCFAMQSLVYVVCMDWHCGARPLRRVGEGTPIAQRYRGTLLLCNAWALVLAANLWLQLELWPLSNFELYARPHGIVHECSPSSLQARARECLNQPHPWAPACAVHTSVVHTEHALWNGVLTNSLTNPAARVNVTLTLRDARGDTIVLEFSNRYLMHVGGTAFARAPPPAARLSPPPLVANRTGRALFADAPPPPSPSPPPLVVNRTGRAPSGFALVSDALARLGLHEIRSVFAVEASLGEMLTVAQHRANLEVARELATRDLKCLTPATAAVEGCLAAPDAPAGRFVAAACGALTQRWQRDGRPGAVLPQIRVALNYSVCAHRGRREWVTLAVAECGGNTSRPRQKGDGLEDAAAQAGWKDRHFDA